MLCGMHCICLLVVSVLVSNLNQAMSAKDDAECLEWALQRLTGTSEVNVTATAADIGGASDHRGHRPGKRGAVGPRGIQGPPGPPGVCDCIPDEMTDLQEKYKVLQDKMLRILRTSPETFCLLGMKDRSIPTSAITVSSRKGYENYARLDYSSGAWYPSSSYPGHAWVMADLGKVRPVTGVATQGHTSSYWVTRFKVEYSKNGVNFTDVKNVDRSEKIFNGNTKAQQVIINRFPEPVDTRFVRIYPMAYNGRMDLRFDVIDC